MTGGSNDDYIPCSADGKKAWIFFPRYQFWGSSIPTMKAHVFETREFSNKKKKQLWNLFFGFLEPESGWVPWWQNLILMLGYVLYIAWMYKNKYLLWKILGGPAPDGSEPKQTKPIRAELVHSLETSVEMTEKEAGKKKKDKDRKKKNRTFFGLVFPQVL